MIIGESFQKYCMKETEMKRITALILVMVLIFSMASAAFAEKKTEKKTEKSPTVYVTGSSKVYHESECPNTWNGRYKTTLKEAHKNRLKPCTECCPVEYDKDNEETMEEPVYVVMGKAVYHCADCSLIWEEDVWYGTKMTLKKAQTNELRPLLPLRPGFRHAEVICLSGE